MNDERWEDVKESIQKKFKVSSEKVEPEVMTDDIGNTVEGSKESIIFETPNGEMKLSRVKRPMIVDKKAHYHKAKGGDALMEYVTSDTETTSKITLYRYNKLTDEWVEVKVDGESLSF
ncbi:hypothetical protein M1146_04935 [Patescibacteria group bacterium]|nr:hypothetical protein [Patescibacteria group bacterium]